MMNSSNNWHLLQGDEVLKLLETDMSRGLSAAEAKRRKRDVEGEVWHVRRTSAGEAAAAALFDLPTLLMAIATAAAALFDKKYEAGVIAAILLIGAFVRTAAGVRANRILEDMARSRIPVSSVIRDGRILLLPAGDIVPGDMIFLEPGDTVPCDGRVITGEDSVVSERGITSNPPTVHKFDTVISTDAEGGAIPCEFRSNMLFAGSQVLTGSLRIVATACGEDTLVAMEKGGITIDAERDFPLIDRLKRQSRAASLIMLAAVMLLSGAALFMTWMARGSYPLPEVFLGAMAMAVASMSEFMSTVAAIVIAVTVRQSASPSPARRSAPARQSAPARKSPKGRGKPAGEDAGGTDAVGEETSRVFFRDPARMEEAAAPDALVFCGSNFFKSGRAELLAYRVKGAYTGIDEEGGDPGELLRLADAAALVTGTRRGMGLSSSEKRFLPHKAAHRALLVNLAEDAWSKKTGVPMTSRTPVADHRDSSERLAAGLEISLCEMEGNLWAVACGSLEEVLRSCRWEDGPSGQVPLTAEKARRFTEETETLMARGAHVLAVAKRISPYPHLNRLAVLTEGMTFMGFFAVSLEPEKDARENIEYLKESGVTPILFSESPEEDYSYCARLGLFDEDTPLIPAAEWNAVSAGKILSGGHGALVAFDSIGNAYLGSAYARAMASLVGGKPEGATVAAVGMEAWDAGALGRADLGLAAAGSRYRAVPESIARNAAAILRPAGRYTESGFGGLDGAARAVRAARCAMTNVSRARFYLTAAQSGRMVVMLAAVAGLLPLPNAAFILIWGLLFDFAAALVRSFDRDDDPPTVPIGGENEGGDRGRRSSVSKRNSSLPLGRDSRSRDGRSRSSRDRRIILAALVGGLFWGLLLTLATIVLGRALPAAPLPGTWAGDGDGSLRVLLSASAILSGLVFSAECGSASSLFSKRSFHPAQLLFALGGAALSAWMLFTEGGARIVGGDPCGVRGFFALIPALAVLVTAEILKLFRFRGRGRGA